MSLKYYCNCEDVDWEKIPEILKTVGMSYHSADVHRITFSASASVVFVYDEQQLIGFGRAISDRLIQAALFDVAVLPSYQGEGIGRRIIDKLVESLPGCNFILYAAPGKEFFYQKLNFRRMKTAMALFINQETMITRGFTE